MSPDVLAQVLEDAILSANNACDAFSEATQCGYEELDRERVDNRASDVLYQKVQLLEAFQQSMDHALQNGDAATVLTIVQAVTPVLRRAHKQQLSYQEAYPIEY